MTARKDGFDRGPIFIVGCPRSGTTLLQRMLDAHPLIAIAPETFFVRRFFHNKKKYGDLKTPRNLALLLAELTQLPEFKEMGLNGEVFYNRFQGRTVDYGEVFADLLRAFRELRGKPIVGEKTPNHLLYMREIERMFDGARFVHLIRDPRGVVESWRRVPWSNGSLESDADVWRRYMQTAREKPPQRAPLLEVSYESLIREPHVELTRLCSFLEVPFAPEMARFHEQEVGTVNVEREPWKSAVLTPSNSVALDRWRHKLSRPEVEAVEAVVYYEMLHRGYRPETKLSRLLPAAWKRALRRRVEAWQKRGGTKKETSAAGSEAD